jgi:hypothetical protein
MPTEHPGSNYYCDMPNVSILHDPEAVREAVARSDSMKAVLGLLGLRAGGANYSALHEACARLGIEAPRRAPKPPTGRRWQPVPDAEVFCVDSTYLNRDRIKQRLISSGVPERCAICGLGPEWQGQPLTLHLDHINGVFNDNRRENLRLLCPNCHSQTETYSGRSAARAKAIKAALVAPIMTPCRYCAHLNRPTAQRCRACRRWFIKHPGRPKIVWPEDTELLSLVSSGTLVAVGELLGVSDTAVRKRLRSRGLGA